MSSYTRSARKLALGGVIAAASLTAMAAPAMAAPTTTTLNATCDFPLVGLQPATIAITTNLPTKAKAGKPVSFGEIPSVVTLGGQSPQLFRLIGAETVEGTNEYEFPFVATGFAFDFSPRAVIAPVAVSGRPETVVLAGTAPAAIVTFPQSGPSTLSAGGFELELTARDENGSPIEGLDLSGDDTPGTFTVPCTVDAGQNTLLGSIDVR